MDLFTCLDDLLLVLVYLSKGVHRFVFIYYIYIQWITDCACLPCV